MIKWPPLHLDLVIAKNVPGSDPGSAVLPIINKDYQSQNTDQIMTKILSKNRPIADSTETSKTDTNMSGEQCKKKISRLRPAAISIYSIQCLECIQLCIVFHA